MRQSQTYTISEAAGLTGMHRNTIRTRIRLGQLEATVHQGKFGEEYRITREALVKAGLLSPSGPLDEAAEAEPVFQAHVVDSPDEADAPPPGSAPEPEGPAEQHALANTVAALGELYQRHEQAMFRLGYLQGELERAKALAETAESLQRDNEARGQEVNALKNALAEKEAQAAETERVRSELDAARAQLREMELLRRDLDRLKQLAEQQESTIGELEATVKRPFWQFWKRG
jgi:excisionase family DNA binding protein